MTKDPTAPPRALTICIVLARIAAVVTAGVVASGTYAGWQFPADPGPRNVVLFWGIVAAFLAAASWGLEEWRKRKVEGARKTLSELLEAEEVRTRTVVNGAFLPTVAALQTIAALDAPARGADMSGFRQRVVERSCDLVRATKPRAAFFRVQNLEAGQRTMRPEDYISNRERTDEFTAEFVEGSGVDDDVWKFIDTDPSALLVPETVVPGKAYHCYISAPVRAGDIAFGMLTLNVLEVGELTQADADALLVLARLLAAAETVNLQPTDRARISKISRARRTLST